MRRRGQVFTVPNGAPPPSLYDPKTLGLFVQQAQRIARRVTPVTSSLLTLTRL